MKQSESVDFTADGRAVFMRAAFADADLEADTGEDERQGSAETYMTEVQIKSKQRVEQHGEVLRASGK